MGLTDSLEYLEEEMMEWKFGKKNLLDARSAMSSVSVTVDNLSEETLLISDKVLISVHIILDYYK